MLKLETSYEPIAGVAHAFGAGKHVQQRGHDVQNGGEEEEYLAQPHQHYVHVQVVLGLVEKLENVELQD